MVENKDSLLLALDQVAELAARGAASSSLVVGALRQAHEAISTLPIAVEGKVEALDWEGSGTWNVAATVVGRYVVRPCLATKYDGEWLMLRPEKETSDLYPSEAEAKRAAQTDYETRILSALISSPGKDGGQCDGNRMLPWDRDTLGRMVREAWVRWAETQPSPKPSWLVPYEELSEADKEADRQIGEAVARWTLIGDAAKAANREDVDA